MIHVASVEAPLLGSYCARFAGERQLTAWHLIESEVADRLVTHCGRQMHYVER